MVTNKSGFAAMLRGAGVARLNGPDGGAKGWIRVAGEDRVRWLNGMVTNSIQALTPGEGCFNFLLNAQGRIQGTAWAWAEAEAVLLETERSQVEGMLAMLDRFIIMDDVELRDETAAWFGTEVFGERALAWMDGAGLAPGATDATSGWVELQWKGEAVRVLRLPAKVVDRYEVWSRSEDLAEQVVGTLRAAGALEAGEREMEWLRMMEGTPRFGVDIRERELPQETGQTEALHFSKGCYLGQEIVERIRSRGAVHRTFRGFALESGALPATGAVLEAEGKAVGELTSVAELPALPGCPDGLRLGLGYVRREAVEAGREIRVVGENGAVARPIRLPVSLKG